MKSASRLALLAFLLLGLLSVCEIKRDTFPVSVTLTPKAANLLVGESVQFWATVYNSTNREVTWTLSGVGCSGATCGTISNAGLYTAPASVPSPNIVIIKAVSAADTSKSASATIAIFEAGVDWTWVSGSNFRFQPGIYGTQGIANLSNVPGARQEAVSWLDPGGKFWLFGGLGYDSAVGGGTLNDLWKFDPATLEWTWVSGSSSNGQAGSYGTKGIPSPSNVPGARQEGATWVDSQGNLWLLGGDGYDSIPWVGQLNDLWKFDPTILEWAWISGSSSLASAGAGIYGTKGVTDPLNRPGGKIWGFIVVRFPGGILALRGRGRRCDRRRRLSQ